eukprot:TRINITY_DN31086_c0_g1_i1.p1 TRINITY_DN31086_c0_g1~~TRINITY_DN31086_c0_g1_i1.p1  ORF type:complete len:121 (+),score=9.08 TRINITY_DN31086_c0_g1_i1:65-427(+)
MCIRDRLKRKNDEAYEEKYLDMTFDHETSELSKQLKRIKITDSKTGKENPVIDLRASLWANIKNNVKSIISMVKDGLSYLKPKGNEQHRNTRMNNLFSQYAFSTGYSQIYIAMFFAPKCL